MNYFLAFAVGGGICVVGQLLIDYTKLTPARILTGYVVAGVILSAVGLYKPLADLRGRGPACRCSALGTCWHRARSMRWTSAVCRGPSPAG